MNKLKWVQFFILAATNLYYYNTKDFTGITIILTTLSIILVVHSYGKSLNVTNLLKIHTLIVFLAAPVIGYNYFNLFNPLSRSLIMFMPVDSHIYFSFILPAISFYFIGLDFFMNESKETMLLKKLLRDQVTISPFQRKNGYLLVFIGISCYYIRLLMPQSLAYIFNILFLSLFPGLLYLAFNKKKKLLDILIISAAISWLLLLAIKSVLFTIIAYMSITISGIVLYKIRLRLITKFIFVFFCIILLLSLQYTKMEIRHFKEVNKTEISTNQFITTFFKNTTLTFVSFNPDLFFPIYIRINQGRLTGFVLNYIPRAKNFDSGKRLFQTIMSSFIPRVFWPDKPEAGGKFNMQYYANLKLDKASMNVGPIGEAYGAFGRKGGLIYMFIFGASISLAFAIFISLCTKRPLLVFWLPVIFYQTVYSAETDSMQVFNSILKTSFLLIILFYIFPGLLKSVKTLKIEN